MRPIPNVNPSAGRVIIENVRPVIDGGEVPVKRTQGDFFRVSADIFTDGHDKLMAVLWWRHVGSKEWFETDMAFVENDQWSGVFLLESLGVYEFAVLAWLDRFGSWRSDTLKKFEAGDRELKSDCAEGCLLIEEVIRRAKGKDKTWLKQQIAAAQAAESIEDTVRLLTNEALKAVVDRYPDARRINDGDTIYSVHVDRVRARYGAWYEFFPRSAGKDPSRSATFREAEAVLPDIADMGFQVIYLPPIHPIGKAFRKGPNNTLKAGPNDPGSPWAIGSEAGGHKSVHPDLGTIKDFDRFVKRAAELGLEVALDIAFQCSPDHPYVREHPEWFRHRPDGSIKYAENPPKKYQDIYPLDFECEDWKALWEELLSIVLFWVEHGVRIFRVDNPHTKPYPFWEWLIGSVQQQYPDVIFLAEAFTRPKLMKYLAKCGFGQSYSYFTWRNTKGEIESYLKELTQTECSEYMRPNFFANTPDIFHEYLQFGGRAAHQIRYVLAGTLAANCGIYGPSFELCESEAVAGTEEYKDSEKYQIRVWDRKRAGNIKSLIKRVNELRERYSALQYNTNLQFHAIDNSDMIAYSKCSPAGTQIILVVVCLNPYQQQGGWLDFPVVQFGIGPGELFQVHDLLTGNKYLWNGPKNYIQLNPSVCPAHIFHVKRKVHTERDFDYFH